MSPTQAPGQRQTAAGKFLLAFIVFLLAFIASHARPRFSSFRGSAFAWNNYYKFSS
jgi:hypothetical protein